MVISCSGKYDEGLFNEVALIVTDDEGNNLFDPNGSIKLNRNDIKVYYLDSNGERKLQNTNYSSPPVIFVKYSPKIGTYYLVIRINLFPNSEGYSKSIIDFGHYGETEIKAKVDSSLPLVSPMAGTIGYEELIFNGKKIPSNRINSFIHLRLNHKKKVY